MKLRLLKSLTCCCILSSLLAACGSGGGPSRPAVSALVPVSPPSQLGCVGVSGGECISIGEFVSRRDALAERKVRKGDYSRQPVFRLINAHRAHAALELTHGVSAVPGSGIRVAVIDSGFDPDHSVFDGVNVNYVEITDTSRVSHGTAVASIVAGNRLTVSGSRNTEDDSHSFLNGRIAYTGLAPGVNLDLYGIDLKADQDAETAIQMALESQAQMVNMSFGYSGIFAENYFDDRNKQSILYRSDAMIQLMRQDGVDDPTLFIFAGGNDHGDPCDLNDPSEENCILNPDADPAGDLMGMYNASSPSPDAALMIFVPELQSNVVVVVAAKHSGEIADFSNRCGVAAEWCITAPGDSIQVANTGDNQLRGASGTSYAAPVVTGGLALMRHFFRGNLNNPELLARLYATANKSGIYGDREIYGQGLMDLGAAMSPVGTPLLPGVVASAGRSISSSRIRLGTAFGDGLTRSLAGQEVAAFDALGAPFWFNLSNFVDIAERDGYQEQELWMRSLRQPFLASDFTTEGAGLASFSTGGFSVPSNGWRGGFHGRQVNTPSSLLNIAGGATTISYASGGWEFTSFTTVNRDRQRDWQPQQGAVLVWRPRTGQTAGYGVRLGILNEPSSLLGSRGQDAFGQLSARSAVLGLEWHAEWLGWRIAADTEWGFVDGTAADGLLKGLSGVTTSAASLRTSRRLGHSNELMLSLSQPPRVESGSLNLRVPIGRTPGGGIQEQTLRSALAPSKRQIDLTAHWRHRDVLGGELRLGALYTRNFGHIAGPGETGVLLAWSSGF